MSTEKTKDRMEYFVACVAEFAKAFGLDMQAAFGYLDQYQGIDFLTKCHDAEHTLSFDDADLSSLKIRRFAPVVGEEFARFVMANRQPRSRAQDHNRDNRHDIVDRSAIRQNANSGPINR